jgi:hypothetical protein
MKKVNKLLALSAFIMTFGYLMTSCNCDVDKKDAAGAIGKVEKYRKDQMSENDIKLRSEIMKDTAALGDALRGMLLVYVYNDAHVKEMKKSTEKLKFEEAKTGIDLGSEQLGSYCTMAENGNGQLCEMCQMCADIYNDTVTEFSFDVEQNVRNYANYLDKLYNQDSAVGKVIDKSDFWIRENENNADKKEQVKNVKRIRDELLLRDITHAAVVNNMDKINNYSSKIVYNVTEALENVYNVKSFDEFKNKYSIMSSENLEAVYNGKQAMENFNATGYVGSFVEALEAYSTAAQNNIEAAGNVVESQQHMDAASGLAPATENLEGINPSASIVYSGIFINSANVVESFNQIRNMDNLKVAVVTAFGPFVSNAGNNVESQVYMDAFEYSNVFTSANINELASCLSQYVVQSSNINLENVENLSAVIQP